MDDGTQRALERHAEHYRQIGLQVFSPEFVSALDSLVAFYELVGFGQVTLEIKNHELCIIYQQSSMTLVEFLNVIKSGNNKKKP